MRRVVVVDDDLAFGLATVEQLEKAGISARFQRGPYGCIQAVRDSRCELVLVDINMPRLDGPLVVRLLRDALGRTGLLIVVCSDMEPTTLGSIAQKCNAHGFIVKSSDPREMVARIGQLLGATGRAAPSSSGVWALWSDEKSQSTKGKRR